MEASQLEVKDMARSVWVEKAWGRTRRIADGPYFEVHELEIKEGGFCSRHCHLKQNLFHIQEGTLVVELFEEDSSKEKTDENSTWLFDQPYWVGEHLPGDQCLVAPRKWHRFRARTFCRVIEVYMIGRIHSEDIVRFDEGGLDTPARFSVLTG